jgi:hypothetical protein
MCRQPRNVRQIIVAELYGFPLPPAALPIGDTSLTHVMKLAAHSTKPPTPTTMVQSFIMTCIVRSFKFIRKVGVEESIVNAQDGSGITVNCLNLKGPTDCVLFDEQVCSNKNDANLKCVSVKPSFLLANKNEENYQV